MIHVDAHRGEVVRRVRYLPDRQSVISCGVHPTDSVVLQDALQRNKKSPYRFHVDKGVECFDFDENANLLVTGSADHAVRLWNPYCPQKPTAVIRGHAAAIIDVLVLRMNEDERKSGGNDGGGRAGGAAAAANPTASTTPAADVPDDYFHEDVDNKSNLLILSYSKDGCLKVWDSKDQRCVQSLQLRFPNLMAGRNVEQSPYSLTLQTKPFQALTVVCGDYLLLLKL